MPNPDETEMNAASTPDRRTRGPRASYTPTAEEILAECARIREKWSPEERALRMSNSRLSWTAPQMQTGDEFKEERKEQ